MSRPRTRSGPHSTTSCEAGSGCATTVTGARDPRLPAAVRQLDIVCSLTPSSTATARPDRPCFFARLAYSSTASRSTAGYRPRLSDRTRASSRFNSVVSMPPRSPALLRLSARAGARSYVGWRLLMVILHLPHVSGDGLAFHPHRYRTQETLLAGRPPSPRSPLNPGNPGNPGSPVPKMRPSLSRERSRESLGGPERPVQDIEDSRRVRAGPMLPGAERSLPLSASFMRW